MSRIVQIIPTLDRGGAEKQLCLLAAGLRQRGFDVEVVALTRGGPLAADLEAAQVPLTIIGKRFKADPLAYRRLVRLLKDRSPTIVQTWLFAANAYGRAAALQAGVPWILASERCVDPWKGWWQLAIDRWLAPRTERIIVNSSAIRDFYVEHGLPPEKFLLIPNGVPPAKPSQLTRAQLISSLGLPADARLVGIVGRLWPQKRHKDAIWAIDLLKTVMDGVHLLIVGDGPLRPRLERYCRLIHVTDRVHFLGHRDDVPDLLPHLDCVVQPSEYEGQPNALLEAMAAGRPVVASEIPPHAELIEPDRTGLLAPLGDRGKLAAAMKKLLDHPDLANTLATAAQTHVGEHYSVDLMVDRYVRLYEEMLGNSRVASSPLRRPNKASVGS